MGEEDNKNTSDISAETLARIAAMEKDIAEIAGLRKKMLWVNLGGAVVVLVILVAFLGNLFNFARTYDTGALLSELQNQGQEILQSPQTQDTLRQMQAEFIPLYREALIKEFNARASELRKSSLALVADLEKYVKNDAKTRVEAELAKALRKVEQELIKRYSGLNLSSEQVEEVFNHGQARFVEETARHLQNRLNGALQELAVLQAKFNQFKDDPEYAAIKNEPVDEIKCRMIESMLELWIYNLNPAKGERLAKVEGGNK